MSTDAGTAALVAVRTRVQVLHEALDAVEAAEDPTPGSAAGLRDAATRLAALLTSLRGVLDPEGTRAAREHLAALAAAAGAVRDTEVLTGLLADLLREVPRALVVGPVADRVRLRLRERRGQVADALAKAVRDEACVAMVRTVDRLVITPPLTDAGGGKAATVLARAARDDDDRLAAAVEAVRAAAPGAAHGQEWAAVREEALALSGSADAAAPEHGKRARRLVRAADEIVDRIDELGDADSARRFLVDLADLAHRSREPGFTYGLLHAEAGRRGAVARAGAEDALDDLAEKKLHSWLPGH